MMKVLLDILHPAHAHFFRHAIRLLESAGHEVMITARDKDLTLQLLARFGFPYHVISREAPSRAGLAGELLARDVRLAQVARRWRPDVMASIAGISTALVGFLTRIRNLVFYDTENATLSNLLSYPFATEVITPDCYRRRVLGRHVTYAGYHELAYLHPNRFRPDPSLLEAAGVDPEEPYSVVRFVSWRALHDVGKGGGISAVGRQRLLQVLSERGRVFVTSEDRLPEKLADFEIPVPPDQLHHLLSFARLYVGESSTMASESAILGTPAVYIDPIGTPFTDEQEQRYGLCFNFKPEQLEDLLSCCRDLLERDLKRQPKFQARRERMLADKIDVTDLIIRKLIGERPASD
jgi:predicted glycosyltransferase